MGGRSSRQKGLRGEYTLRNYLRQHGWKADRVPSSGAAQGFPGDVAAEHPEHGKRLFEMKFRKDLFGSIYALYEASCRECNDDVLAVAFAGEHKKQLLAMSTHLDAVLTPAEFHTFYQLHPLYGQHARAFGRLPKMQSLLKESDILVLKDNNRPLLFLRYR